MGLNDNRKFRRLDGADAGSFARLQGLDTEGKDVGDFVTLSQQVEVK